MGRPCLRGQVFGAYGEVDVCLRLSYKRMPYQTMTLNSQQHLMHYIQFVDGGNRNFRPSRAGIVRDCLVAGVGCGGLGTKVKMSDLRGEKQFCP